MAIFIFFVAVWYLSLFMQSFFQHRYAAHGAFTMSKGWEKFFFILTYLLQGPSYLSPRVYAIMHRLHHAHTDTAEDPHSPSFSKNIFDMMWRTRNYYLNMGKNRIPVEEKYLKNVPEWPAFDRFADSALSRVIWVGLYFAFFWYFVTSPWQWLLFPLTLIMCAFHGAIVNWFAHKYGYINFRVRNTSKNLLFIDFLMLGESYHNNHHKHPSRVNFGTRWHEIDPLYPVILLFDKLGIIRITKTPALATAPLPVEPVQELEAA